MEFHKEAVAVQICSLPTVVQLKMSYHMKMVLRLNGFADDHTINKSFKPDRLGAELETKLTLQNCLCNISEWASKIA